ncbi:MAG: tetratricopeptide repeat protein [Paracoccus sp. (in: a-proteobacteria)]|uniref:tetratricopeptide repeat protein n=1 Tax=Paracoccus sp. TaxID=267 RepID=UPI0026DFC05C|nr:tetratricopeptide repeat protein [Paracoccus sp. (in: a-proteobacteria)]MDO5632093.1 tetratricopeptide repeat protein [Paracoccus sp. (in: a-proteobacteria)]
MIRGRVMMRAGLTALALCVAVPLAAPAQPAPETVATLADLRAQLRALAGELQSLRAELNASGAAGFQAAGGDSAIDRMNAIETQIARLTGQTEQLQNRIGRIVTDGTRRINDIEFRLCEMDPACDLGAVMTQPDLGSMAQGGAPVMAPVIAPDSGGNGGTGAAPASTTEQAEFDRAQEVLGQGDFPRAAELFAAFAQAHAGGPLTAHALFLRGAALDSAGDPQGAGAAWLESFAAAPDGPQAGASLLGLARVISDSGDALAACLYLAEIPARFPGSAAADEANRRLAALDCASQSLPLIDDPEAAADLAEHG